MIQKPLPAASFGFHVVSAEVSIYRRYLDALGRVTNLLLEDANGENWSEALELLADASRTQQCAIYLNNPGQGEQTQAVLSSSWHATGAQDMNVSGLNVLDYESYSLLSDTLQIGMVFTKNLTELPPAEFGLFKGMNISGVMCIPLLVGGEMTGFLGLFGQREKHEWLPMEIDILCVAANNFAAALARQRVEHSLRASESRLKVLVGATEDVVLEFDADGKIHHVWSDHQALLLQDATAGDLTLSSGFPPEMAHGLLKAMPRVLSTGRSEIVEFSLSDALGDRFLTGRLQPVPSEDGSKTHLVALIRDVTTQIQEESRRQTMLETLDMLEEAIVDMRPDGKLTNVSAGWNKLLGEQRTGISAIDHSLLKFVHQEDQANVIETLSSLERGQVHSASTRFRMHTQGGDPLWVEARLLAHRSPHGQVTCMRGILRDVTASYLEQTRVTRMALHDALTQLPNRVLLQDHLGQAIIRAQRNRTKVALGFIDLDRFKQINDTLGHQAGDAVLLTLSQRLHGVLREMDTLCRWGGDEFVVLMPDFILEADIRVVADRLMEAGRRTIEVESELVHPTLSIGFAIYPTDADDAESLMTVADHTMFYAKRNGRDNVQFYRDIEG
ncbi:MAG: diguanylate cyclase [Sulfuricellaceae bacterium]|nr:diguanylate cyclase [Sulfuricellaceae bacterium]